MPHPLDIDRALDLRRPACGHVKPGDQTRAAGLGQGQSRGSEVKRVWGFGFGFESGSEFGSGLSSRRRGAYVGQRRRVVEAVEEDRRLWQHAEEVAEAVGVGR